MKILILDNYDSFTYNLVHLVEKIQSKKVHVHRNDKISLEAINDYDKIILSPGPGIPEEAGILIPLIKEYGNKKSILGVCLGHQAIALAYGGELINLSNVYHGVATKIIQEDHVEKKNDLFKTMPKEFDAGRYHSWIVNKEKIPKELQITALDENGYIMALQHRSLDIQGVQFHPESVLTPDGEIIMRNWLSL